MKKLTEPSKDPLADEYYKNFDIDIFNKKLSFLVKNVSKLKSEKAKKVYSTELYATYLQIVEIFCINMFAASDKDLAGNIFLNPTELNKKIESRFYKERTENGEDYVSYLINNFVFALKDDVKDRTSQKVYYKRFVKEAIDDYLKDKQFLNSYKHGFRVFPGEKAVFSIGLTGSNESFLQQEFSSSIYFYSKSEDKTSIVLCSVFYNWQRVYIKSLVLLNILENTKKSHFRNEQVFNYLTFDPKLVDNKKGCVRQRKQMTQIKSAII